MVLNFQFFHIWWLIKIITFMIRILRQCSFYKGRFIFGCFIFILQFVLPPTILAPHPLPQISPPTLLPPTTDTVTPHPLHPDKHTLNLKSIFIGVLELQILNYTKCLQWNVHVYINKLHDRFTIINNVTKMLTWLKRYESTSIVLFISSIFEKTFLFFFW